MVREKSISTQKIENMVAVLFFVVFIVVLAASFYSLSKPMIAEPDAYDRILHSQWLKDRSIFFDTKVETWLPLHFTFLSMAIELDGNYTFYPRLLSVLVSLATTLPLYHLTKSYFSKAKDDIIPIITVILYIILPIRFFLSSQTFSEHFFLFFFISSLYFGLKKKPNIILAVILMNISHSLRYESWLFLPFWFFLISTNKNLPLTHKVATLLGSLIFPFYWANLSYVQNNDPFYFFTYKNNFAQSFQLQGKWNLNISFSVWWIRLIEVLGIPALLGIFYSFYKNEQSFFSDNVQKISLYFLPVYFFSLLVFQVFIGSMEWFPHRYLLLPVTLALPLLAKTIYEIPSLIKDIFIRKNINLGLISLIAMAIIAASYISTFSIAKNVSKANLLENKNILLDVVGVIDEPSTDTIYIHNDLSSERLWLASPFFYFTGNSNINEISKSSFLINPDKNFDYLIVEKNEYPFDAKNSNYSLIFENEKLQLYKQY